jgi:NAD(P)H dehydrogenase (quinone)
MRSTDRNLEMPYKLLVTGAAGHLGGRIIASLLEGGKIAAGQIVAATRKPADLADLARLGVDVRFADFDDSASLEKAFAGVARMALVSTDALGRRLAQHTAAIAAAVRAGVKHIVYTSMPKPETSPVTFAPDHAGTEKALAASGLGWTVLRNSWYQENLMGALPSAVASGHWYSAAGEGRLAHVAREDCARVAAAVLIAPPAGNQTFTLTGARALSTHEIAALASEVLGKPIAVVDVTPEQLAGGMKAAGMPDAIIPMLVSFDANTKSGNMDIVTDAVKQFTGHEPRSLRDFLAASKAALTAG